MIKDFSAYSLPKEYMKDKGKCYLDPVRKRLTYITPEETVRQQVIAYLRDDLKVPLAMLKSEEHLSHYGIESSDRADIIIHKFENDVLVPIAVIECKAPNIYLGEKETNQLVRYANSLYADYIMLTNGYEIFCYHYDEKEEIYKQIEEFPNYEKMVDNQFQLANVEIIPDRITFNSMKNFILESRVDNDPTDIGRDTTLNLAYLSLNLWECLLDVKKSMPIKKYGIFEIKEDLGVRLLSYGNASGGIFSGPYRSFLIEFNGINQIVSFGVSSYSTYAKPDIRKTAINIALDTEESAHHSLQLVVDDNVIEIGNEYKFYHHGRIAVGKIGSGKVKDLKKIVNQYYPKIISEQGFYLGTIKNDRLLSFDNQTVCELLENLISYALIRDVYRNEVKNK